ncbi:DUF2254 family protein [Streptomyces sp. NPDC006527]|uniref:DUF2254 family protein n=1 Tax=Streptomyces sp. NPDC006527 TaxID=3364749 RepID=UPI00367F1D95
MIRQTGTQRQAAALHVRADRAGAIQAVHVEGLRSLARAHDCLLVLRHAVGDFVTEGAVPAEAFGDSVPPARAVRELVALGQERTIDQDPAFAIRVLVDIAIKALCPAVNDPTTAVQVSNYLEQRLQVAAAADLSYRYGLVDATGTPRVLVPGRGWDEYLALAVTGIRACGAESLQVCRRLRAVLTGLRATVPTALRPAVVAQLAELDAAVDRAYQDETRRAAARVADRQGLGGSGGVGP